MITAVTGNHRDRDTVLDAMRGLAALAVFASHVRNVFFVNYGDAPHSAAWTLIYFLTSLGHTAVIVFFVLSGYFVGGSSLVAFMQGRWSWPHYLVARLTRLWVVLLPALMLTAALDLAGRVMTHGAGLYSGPRSGEVVIAWSIPARDTLVFALGNAMFLQDILVPTFGSNGPLWSLSYEFWYYIMFPLVIGAALPRVAIRIRAFSLVLATGILLFTGRDIAAYFLTWLLGAAVAWYRRSVPPPLGPTGAWIGVVLVAIGVGATKFAGPAADGVVAVATAVGVAVLPGRSARTRLGQVADGLARMSYTLYLVHLPMLVFLRAMLNPNERWPADARYGAVAMAIGAIVLGVAWLLARVTEARTDDVRRWVTRRLVRVSQSSDDDEKENPALIGTASHADHVGRKPG